MAGRIRRAIRHEPEWVSRDPDERRHRTMLRVTIGLGVLGLIVTLGLGISQLVQSSGPDSPDERLAACREAHDAPSKVEGWDSEDEQTRNWTQTFSDCSWPPLPGAGKDGYYTIEVTRHGMPVVPGEDTWIVDVIESPCQAYELEYRNEQQGTSVVRSPLRLANNQIVAIKLVNGSPQVTQETVPSSVVDEVGDRPDGRLIVLAPVGDALSRLECLDPRSEELDLVS